MSLIIPPSPGYDGNRILRSAKYSDWAVKSKNRRRKTGNAVNVYRTDIASWSPTSLSLSEPLSLPYSWQGAWDFKWAQLDTLMQAFVSDASSSNKNGVLWGMRLSWRPDLWVNWKLLETNSGVTPSLNVSDRTVTWPNVLSGPGHLRVDADPERVSKTIRFDGQPSKWPRFAIRQGLDCTFEIINESYIRFLDPFGNEYMHTNPAFGWWGNADFTHKDAVRASLRVVEDEPITVDGHIFRTIRLIPVSSEWLDATFPIFFDPTVTINDTASIEDCYMNMTADLNYNSTSWWVYAGYYYGSIYNRPLIRLGSSSIPAGTVNSFTFNFYGHTGSGSQNISYHRIASSKDWVESYAKWSQYKSGANWTAQGASNVPGDISTDGAVAQAWGSNGWQSVSLAPNWASDWRDGVWQPQGFRMASAYISSDYSRQAYSSEYSNASLRPFFEIDYTEASSGHSFFFVGI